MPPQASAGPDQTVIATSTVHLSAEDTVDDNGGWTLRWQQTAGPDVELSDPTSLTPSFVAPLVTVDTVLTFLFTITDDEGAIGTDSVDITVQPIPDTVTISGNINHGAIVHGSLGTGLNYSSQGFATMHAEVLVEAIDATTQQVLASGRFAGEYELVVPSQREVAIRVTAAMVRRAPRPLPHWRVVVRDLDDAGNPLGPAYSFSSPAFNSGPGGTHDVNIPSGWSNSGQLIGPRDAAPFAILEAVVQGIDLVLEVDPSADFPDLTIDWGPDNVGGQTFYTSDPGGSNRRIVLSGERDVDTDEYDPHVILHEFGHYLDDSFARLDSIGGPHGFGDLLDLRVAFSEGLATALGAIALGDPYYRDSFGPTQGDEGYFDLEFDEQLAEGWYSEASTWEIVWDLKDHTSDQGDDVTIGFAPIWQVLTGPQRETDALASIFSFATALKTGLEEVRPDVAAAIAALLSNEQVEGPTIDIFGSTETNDAASADVLPIYTPVQLGQTRQVRSTNEFGIFNKLSNDRFLLLSLAAPANVRFRVSADTGRDADILIFRRGIFVGPANLGPANEDFTLDLEAGDYVLDVYDCGNADCNDDVPPAPTDITVTVSAN